MSDILDIDAAEASDDGGVMGPNEEGNEAPRPAGLDVSRMSLQELKEKSPAELLAFAEVYTTTDDCHAFGIGMGVCRNLIVGRKSCASYEHLAGFGRIPDQDRCLSALRQRRVGAGLGERRGGRSFR